MSMFQTMEALALRVGCDRYPQRWDVLYDQYLSDLKTGGNPYIDPEYYAQLHRQYGILSDNLSLYQNAAAVISQDPALSLFLYVLCRALQDREFHKADMASFSRPQRGDSFACEMLCALAAASEAPLCHALLTERKLPKSLIDRVLRMPEAGVEHYRLRHQGVPGYALLEWYQLAIDGRLFPFGRLHYEIFAPFRGRACVFEDRFGNRIALAHDVRVHAGGMTLDSAGYENPEGSWTAMITETDTHWIGYPVRKDGSVDSVQTQIPKADWREILSYGDPVVSIHIPPGGGLTEDAVDNSLAEAKRFFAEYFPDYQYRAFVCYSWLMDPQLIDIVGHDSNIGKFNLRFTKLTRKSSGTDVFSFVFLKPDTKFDLYTLPERTTLERGIKYHYLAGKRIHEMVGFFF